MKLCGGPRSWDYPEIILRLCGGPRSASVAMFHRINKLAPNSTLLITLNSKFIWKYNSWSPSHSSWTGLWYRPWSFLFVKISLTQRFLFRFLMNLFFVSLLIGKISKQFSISSSLTSMFLSYYFWLLKAGFQHADFSPSVEFYAWVFVCATLHALSSKFLIFHQLNRRNW